MTFETNFANEEIYPDNTILIKYGKVIDDKCFILKNGEIEHILFTDTGHYVLKFQNREESRKFLLISQETQFNKKIKLQ